MNALLRPGLRVLVRVYRDYYELPQVCLGELAEPAHGGWGDSWWVNVFMGGPQPVAQMHYREDEILGVPGAGLTYQAVL